MLGNRIRKIREVKGYSQEYMSDELKISQSAYSDLENNKTRIDLIRLHKIANIFDIDIIELLSINDTQIKKVTDNLNNIPQLVKKLEEQYKTRLKEKDEVIELLKTQLLKK